MSLKSFCLATFLGMLPLTFVYTYFGSILIWGKGLGIILGILVVIMFFMIPRFIERFDLFSMRRVFQHNLPARIPEDTNRVDPSA